MSRMFLLSYRGRRYCCSGPPDNCWNLTLLQAETSEFHTDALIDATERMNSILAELREQAPEGRHLALIGTTFGVLLVWAEAIERPDDLSAFVTAESPEELLRETLGLRPPTETA